MSQLVDILSYSAGSLFWGFLIGIICLALFFFLIKGWYKDAFFTPISYCIGAILGILLIYQSTLMCGAFAIKHAASHYEELLTTYIQTASSFADLAREVTSEESNELCNQLIASNPLLAHYISGADFRGYTAMQLPHAMVQELKSVMNWFILRRVLWSLAFVIIGAFIVIKTMERGYASKRERSAARVTSSNRRRAPITRSNRQRIPRKRR